MAYKSNRFDKSSSGALSPLAGSRKRNIHAAENTIRRGAAKAKKAVGMAANAVKANPGKSGLALAGLAAAGGLGMAGMKAVGARKKKANSLQGRLSSAMKKVGR